MNEDFDRPWPGRRGIEHTDYDNGLILVRTDVEQLASEVGSYATQWKRDVLGAPVRVARDFGWVFRLQGHPWSIFLCENYGVLGSPAKLSSRLSAPVIAYDCSDTMGSIGYVYAEAGKVRESLAIDEDDEVEFSSELRQLEVDSDNAFRVAEQFFRERDAYEPGIYPAYFFADGRTVPRLEVGEVRTVGNPGFILQDGDREIKSVPVFERVDYFTFRFA